MGKLGHILALPLQSLLEARSILFPWVPVLMGMGIGFWFALPREPGFLFYAALIVVMLVCVLLWIKGPELTRPLAIAVGCLALGATAAGARAHLLAAPVLSFRYYGPVEGRIVLIDRSQADQTRLTLDNVVLERVSPARTPFRVRVSLHGDQGFLRPAPGQVIVVTAHLSSPEGPVEPGGFDFQRMALFDQLGAVGYARTPALLLDEPKAGAQIINRWRGLIRHGVEARIEGDAGAFAAALVTGDRAGIGKESLEALRASNLAHLLAISGLHMGLLVGFVFAAVRYGFALVPAVSLRMNSKKLASMVALASGSVYLVLSGGNVATERAFVMVAVMLGAVLCDRRALSLRSVAIAACILLLAQPETLMEPGFQMSFAATVALVAGFGALRVRFDLYKRAFWLVPLYTLFISSLLAGLATAPVGAAHFNRIAGYGLAANLMAVPVMGFAVMPAAVLAGILAPFGLEGPALWVMERGTTWILWVARTVAGWDGAVRSVPSPSAIVLPIMALGALWVILWRGKVRWIGGAPILAAFFLWGLQDRPSVLISADGNLIGLQSGQGRVLSAEKGAGFAARQWLENDGDSADQALAASRNGFSGANAFRSFQWNEWRITQIKGKSALGDLAAACAAADLVVLAAVLEKGADIGDCMVIDRTYLSRTGPIALWPGPDGTMILEPTHDAARMWSSKLKAEKTQVVRLASAKK